MVCAHSTPSPTQADRSRTPSPAYRKALYCPPSGRHSAPGADDEDPAVRHRVRGGKRDGDHDGALPTPTVTTIDADPDGHRGGGGRARERGSARPCAITPEQATAVACARPHRNGLPGRGHRRRDENVVVRPPRFVRAARRSGWRPREARSPAGSPLSRRDPGSGRAARDRPSPRSRLRPVSSPPPQRGCRAGSAPPIRYVGSRRVQARLGPDQAARCGPDEGPATCRRRRSSGVGATCGELVERVQILCNVGRRYPDDGDAMLAGEVEERGGSKAQSSGGGAPGHSLAPDSIENEQNPGALACAGVGEGGGHGDGELDGVGLHTDSVVPRTAGCDRRSLRFASSPRRLVRPGAPRRTGPTGVEPTNLAFLVQKRATPAPPRRKSGRYIVWWAQQDLNLRLLPCEGSTLPLSYAPSMHLLTRTRRASSPPQSAR